MTAINASCVGHRSDRVEDLINGVVAPESINLQWFTLPPAEAFRRMQSGEFDIGEMSLSTHIVRVARGIDDFVAIPVFPSRCFRHSAIYVAPNSPIVDPADLNGKRIGVPEYQMTAALWVRGMLADDHAVDPSTISWVTGGLRDAGRRPLIDTNIPGVEIAHVDDGSLDEMLLAGDLDAIIAPQAPPSFFDGRGTRHLIADHSQAEREYYRRTGLFPIMHTVVLTKRFHESYPWASVSLYRAFEQARHNAITRLLSREPLPISLPWIQDAVSETINLMGEDIWPYGCDANRDTLDAACRYAHAQGLTDRLVDPNDLFCPSVVNLSASGLL